MEHKIAIVIDANGKAAIGVFDATTNAMIKTVNASELLNKSAAEGGKKADDAGKKWYAYGQNVGQVIGTVGTALGALLGKQIANADATGKLAEKLGITTEFISEVGYAAGKSGSSMKALEGSLFGLADNAVKAAEGAKKPSAAFRSLGIDVLDAHGKVKSLEQLLPELADKFARMEDGPRKMAVANAVLGSSARDLLPLLDQGADGIATMRKEAVEFGHSVSGETAKQAGQFKDSIDALLNLAMAFGNQAIKPLLPVLNALAESFLRDASAASKAAADSGVLATAFKTVGVAAAVVRAAIQALVNVLAGAWDTMVTNAKTGSKLVGDLWSGVLGGLEKTWEGDFDGAVKVMAQASDRMTATAKDGAVKLNAAWTSMGDGVRNAGEELARTFDSIVNPAVETVADTSESTTPIIDGLGEGFLGLGDDAETAAERMKRLIERTNEVRAEAADLRAEMADLEAELDGPLAVAQRGYELQLRRINDLHFEGAISTAEATRWQGLLETQLRQTKDATASLIEDLEFERSLIGMTNAEREVAIQLRQLEAGATEEQRARVAELTGAIVTEREAHEENQRQIEESARAWEDFAGGLADAILDGSQGVKRWWKQMIDDMKRQLLQSGLLTLFRSLFGGSSAGAGLSLAGGGGGGGGLMQIFGSLLGGGAGGAGSAGGGNILGSLGGAGGNFMQYAPALAAVAGGAYGLTNRGSSTGSAGSIGAGIAYGTAGYALGTVGYGAALGYGAAGAAGAASGALGAAAAIPVAGWIIAAIAAIDMITGGKVFGTRYRPESSTSTLSIGEDGGEASMTRRDVRNRSLFRGRQWRDVAMDAGDDARDAAEALFDAISGTMTDAARQLAIEVPPVIDAAIRTVNEYDKKGKVKSTKIFVDLLGRTWEEETAELAATRITAESIISVIDAAFAPMPEAVEAAIDPEEIGDRLGRRLGAGINQAINHAGEASQIAERWRDDAEALLDGAQTLLTISADVRNGFDLLGTGTLTPIVDLLDDMAQAGEPLLATYQRVSTATRLLDDALAVTGVALDLGREAYVRHAAAIVDAAGGLDRAMALWQSFDANYFSDEERGARTLARARSGAQTQFGDIGLELNDFTGDGGMAALRQLFEQALPDLSAEATVEWLEALDALAQVTAAQNAYNQVLGQGSRTAAQALEARAILLGVANERAYAQMSTAQRAVADVNARFSELRIALNATNPSIAEAAQLERDRQQALDDANASLRAQGRQLVDDLLFDESLVGMTDLQRAQAEINREFDEYVEQMVDLGFALDSTEIATLNQIRANRILRAEADDAAEAMERQAEAARELGMSWGEIADIIDGFFRDLSEGARRYFGDGAREWVGEVTGVTLREEPAPLATRAGTLARFASDSAAFVADLNATLTRLYGDIERMPWHDQAGRAIVAGQIEAINDVLQMIGDGATDAIDYINAVFDQQLGDLLGGLRREFGTNDPIAEINLRFDELHARAVAWGATNEQLAEIEQYRQAALLAGNDQVIGAIDERYQRELDWIRQLAELRDSLLLDDTLSTLTPQQRLDEAKRQYGAAINAVNAAALTAGTEDDDIARGNFDSIARQYLDEARSFFGSSQDYTDIFNAVLGQIDAWMAASPVTGAATTSTAATSAIAGAPGSEAGVPAQAVPTVTFDVTPVVAATDRFHADNSRENAELRAELQTLQSRVDALTAATDRQTAEIRRGNDKALVRTY